MVRGRASARAASGRLLTEVGVRLLGLLVLMALLAPLIAPHNPVDTSAGLPRLAPPSLAFPFGTDHLRRDVLSRCLYGARISLGVGALAVVVSVGVGTTVGLLAGFQGGVLDRVLTTLTDYFLAVPRLILLIAVAGTLRLGEDGRFSVLVLVLGLTGWMGVARVVRAQVRLVRELDFVTAARAAGLTNRAILVRHILPNVTAPILVYGSLALGAAILAEAALSYLGLGMPVQIATWGRMIKDGTAELHSAPWMALFPGCLLGLTVLALNLVGDGLRDGLDPRVRGRVE